MTETELDQNLPKKQNPKRGKLNLAALWITAVTSLMTTVIPKIIDMLSTKPTIEQVNTMIGAQTQVITKTLNQVIDALKALTSNQDAYNTRLAKMEGMKEAESSMLEACCLRKPSPPTPAPVIAVKPTNKPDGCDEKGKPKPGYGTDCLPLSEISPPAPPEVRQMQVNVPVKVPKLDLEKVKAD